MPDSRTPDVLDHEEITARGFRALLDSTVDGIVIIDGNGKILNFNLSAQSLFGYTEKDVIGKNVKVLMPEPFHSEHDGYIRSYHESGEGKIIGIGRQVRAKKKDGTTFPMFLSVGEYQEGELQYFIGTIRDLTKQIEAEDLAKELNRRLSHSDRVSTMGEMASGVAHELNQPLTAIGSYVQACQRRLKTDPGNIEKLNELLVKVENQAMRAGAIIDRIRALVKPHDLQRIRVPVDAVLREAIQLAEADTNNHGMRLQTDFNTESVEVVIDTVQIQQVLLNLIRNGIDSMIDFHKDHGEICISTTYCAGEELVRVSVSAEGGGISDELKHKLFHPFVSSKIKGTGLGLSISRSIIEAHGGQLDVKDRDPCGAIFEFTIPVVVNADD